MTDKKLAFDTLEYATLLKEKGVANPEAHAASLATVIVQNVNTSHDWVFENFCSRLGLGFNVLIEQKARNSTNYFEFFVIEER